MAGGISSLVVFVALAGILRVPQQFGCKQQGLALQKAYPGYIPNPYLSICKGKTARHNNIRRLGRRVKVEATGHGRSFHTVWGKLRMAPILHGSRPSGSGIRRGNSHTNLHSHMNTHTSRLRNMLVSARESGPPSFDEEDEVERVLPDEFEDEDEMPIEVGDPWRGRSKFIPRREGPGMLDMENPLLDFSGMERVDRYLDWDFEGGDMIDGYEIKPDTNQHYVKYLPELEGSGEDDLYINKHNGQPPSPELLEQLKANDPEYLTVEEERAIVMAEYANSPLRMNESRRLNIASQQPTINVSQLIVDCLKPLDPQYIYVEDLTYSESRYSQAHLRFRVISEDFEGINYMIRHQLAEGMLQPVYSLGVKFIDAHYGAPSEYGRSIIPWISRYNFSNVVGLDINVTDTPWHWYESPPRLMPSSDDIEWEADDNDNMDNIGNVDDDENEHFPQMVWDINKLRELDWWDSEYTYNQYDGRPLHPYTQSAAETWHRIESERDRMKKDKEEDRGSNVE